MEESFGEKHHANSANSPWLWLSVALACESIKIGAFAGFLGAIGVLYCAACVSLGMPLVIVGTLAGFLLIV